MSTQQGIRLNDRWHQFPVGYLFVLGVLYLALVSTALALYLWNKALEMLGAGVASVFFFAQPVTGALLGWLFLHERLDANFFGGGRILVAVGLTIVGK